MSTSDAAVGTNSGYHSLTTWSPLGAFATGVRIVVVSRVIMPSGAYYIVPFMPGNNYASQSIQLVSQVISLTLVWIGAGMWGGRRQDVLSLHFEKYNFQTQLGLASLIWCVTFPVFYLIGQFGYAGEPGAVVQTTAGDDRMKLLFSVMNLLSLVVVAPLEEECLFRGFLLGALSRSKLRFWYSAFFVNVMWMLLHTGYSWQGLLMTFAFGSLLSIALWKTKSLWVCILAHGMYNLELALFQLIFV